MKKYELENIIRQNAEANYRISNYLRNIDEKQKTIQQTQEKGLVENKKLVIIYDKGITRVYENGKEITEGIKSIIFYEGEIPTIKYEKSVS